MVVKMFFAVSPAVCMIMFYVLQNYGDSRLTYFPEAALSRESPEVDRQDTDSFGHAVCIFCSFPLYFIPEAGADNPPVLDFGYMNLLYRPEPFYGIEAPNEVKLLSVWPRLLAFLACPLGGLMYAAALPPLNWEFAAFFALLPVMVYVSLEHRWFMCAAAGWLWGWCWAICSYSFLREIEFIVPWLMAPVIALFPAVWAVLLAVTSRRLFLPPVLAGCGIDSRRRYLEEGPRVLRLAVMGLNAAALYIVIEYSRSRLFVWNDLAVTQYRNMALIQLAAVTGSCGVGFGVALVNSAVWMLFFRRGWRSALVLGVMAVLLFSIGWCYTAWRDVPDAAINWKVLAIQADLSQRRNATLAQVSEAMDVYGDLSQQGLAKHPDADIVIWPESSVPILFCSGFMRNNIALPAAAVMNARYQRLVRDLCLHHRKKLLFGALDFEEATRARMKNNDPPLGITNSALLADEWGSIVARYDKYHRVPFGEYIPFRRYLPDGIVKMIDMGRDLVPGATLAPLTELTLPTGQGTTGILRPGVVICYEGVFGYVTRELCRRGANVLVALSNDAWYPRSSEPEQHLANATLRAVECGIPMVRVGNNSGTGIVMPDGRFAQALEVPGREARLEIRRGRGVKLLNVPVVEAPPLTFYVRCGDIFPLLLIAFTAIVFIYSDWHGRRVFFGLVELKRKLELERLGKSEKTHPNGGVKK